MLGSLTCRTGLVNRQKFKVAERKWYTTCLCAEHFYFHEQHLLCCVCALILCYRVANMSRVTIFFFFFFTFLVIFSSLIANLIRGTATLQNDILTVLRFNHSL